MVVPILAKGSADRDVIIRDDVRIGQRSSGERVRCPLCAWQPSADSLWCCDCTDTPEPFFQSCGTVWNTFATRGRCPGCSHQWKWTTCLQCAQSSLHDDWYERDDADT